MGVQECLCVCLCVHVWVEVCVGVCVHVCVWCVCRSVLGSSSGLGLGQRAGKAFYHNSVTCRMLSPTKSFTADTLTSSHT